MQRDMYPSFDVLVQYYVGCCRILDGHICMVSWFSACKNPLAIRDGCRDQCCRDDKKISQWTDIPCERMLFLAVLILLSREGQIRLVSLFPWNEHSTCIFHGSLALGNTQLMSLLNIPGLIYTARSCLFPKYWLLCHWGGRDKWPAPGKFVRVPGGTG